MNLRQRVAKLENRKSQHATTKEKWFIALSDPDELTSAERRLQEQFHAESRMARQESLENSTAIRLCRLEWARLGILDPVDYADLDAIEELFRLIFLIDSRIGATNLDNQEA